MKGTEFAAYIRLRTKTDSSSFTDANIVVYGNVEKDGVSREVVSVRKDHFVVPATTTLVADQREYSFPNDTLSNLKMVEVHLTTPVDDDWKRVKEFDLNEYRERQSTGLKPYNTILDVPDSFSEATTDETTIRENFSDDNPVYEITRQSIKIYTESAIIDVTDGLKIHYTVYPTDITTGTLASSDDLSLDPSTTSFGIPREFHKYWAMKIVISYKEDNDISLDQFDLDIKSELQKAKKSISQPNQDQTYQPRVPRDTGYQY